MKIPVPGLAYLELLCWLRHCLRFWMKFTGNPWFYHPDLRFLQLDLFLHPVMLWNLCLSSYIPNCKNIKMRKWHRYVHYAEGISAGLAHYLQRTKFDSVCLFF